MPAEKVNLSVTGDRLSKTPTGIAGFDEVSRGGLPRGRTTLLIGGAGSGKTIFATQTLVNGALHDEPGIFVAFEENTAQIFTNMSQFGWDLPGLVRRKKLFMLDAQLSPAVVKAGDFDLTGILSAISAKADEIGARRIVFDGIDVLLALLNDPAAERREIYRLRDWLMDRQLTGIVTAKKEDGPSLLSEQYGFLQFMVDCAVLLQHRMVEDRFLRTIRVLKYRGSGFAENEFPLVITSRGVEVALIQTDELQHESFTDRISTGIDRLDTMLGGGYYRGSSTLVTGAPGTAKTTLSGAFLEAACRRGERALFVSFDEAGSQILRNLASVNIRLEPHVRSGKLKFYTTRSEVRGAEEHFIIIQRLIEEHNPAVLAIDPISALLRASSHFATLGVVTRLLDLAKSRGVTLICSSLVESGEARREHTNIMVSTIADTWIHLSFAIQGGERNRALTVIKSRGTAHSNQVRELILSAAGITLADVYSAGGEVLMGTLRWEKEVAERAAREHERLEHQRRRSELELVLTETAARIELMNRELEARRAELALLNAQSEDRESRWQQNSEDSQRRRGADAPKATPSHTSNGKMKRIGKTQAPPTSRLARAAGQK